MTVEERTRVTPAVVVAQPDGRLVALDAGARRLLGNAVGQLCWRAVGELEEAEGLPCRTGCVRALLERGSLAAQHSRVRVRGMRHSLSCLAVDGRVVCLLSPAADQQPSAWQRPSAREREVLRLLSEGLNTAAIAARLGRSEATVRTHVEHLRDKLGVSNRAALVARGFLLGLLS